MPFNGAGMFTRLRSWVDDAAAGIKIRADFHDIEDDNFAAGISQCIARDGQSVVINNIPLNSKRITSLADPTDPQDASTKAYADTKLSMLTGGTVNGPITANGTITANAQVVSTGYLCRSGLNGSYGGNWFNFLWNGNLQVWVDNYNFGNLATTAYVEQRASDWAHAVADPKVNRAGDTMTGELVMQVNYLRFGSSGGPGYILWNGGGSYALGGGGNIWHTGNLNPIQDGRLVYAGDPGLSAGMNEPWGGTVVTGLNGFLMTYAGSNVVVANGMRKRYMQLLTPGGWYTIGYA